MLDENPKASPEKQPSITEEDLGKLQEQVDQGLLLSLAEVKGKNRDNLLQSLRKEQEEDGDFFNIDSHYFLALGNVSVDEKRLIDFPLVALSDYEKYRVGNHEGDMEYALLSAGVPLDYEFDVWSSLYKHEGERTKTGEKITLRQLVAYTLTHRLDDKYSGQAPYTYDSTEWLTLVALEMAKCGEPVALIGSNGKIWSLEKLDQANRREFNFAWFREKLTKKEIGGYEALKIARGNCAGLHALHALMAYAALKSDRTRMGEHVQFIADQINRTFIQKQPTYAVQSASLIRTPSEEVDFLAHLLTPLRELPKDFPLTPQQKDMIRFGFITLIKTMQVCLEKKEDGFTANTHAQDVLNTVRLEWLQK